MSEATNFSNYTPFNEINELRCRLYLCEIELKLKREEIINKNKNLKMKDEIIKTKNKIITSQKETIEKQNKIITLKDEMIASQSLYNIYLRKDL